jgi:hypothetical protein
MRPRPAARAFAVSEQRVAKAPTNRQDVSLETVVGTLSQGHRLKLPPDDPQWSRR